MFVNEIFPRDISYNSIGATRFTTDVIVVDSGDDQRIMRWSSPLMEYDVAYGVRTMDDLHALIAFFRAMRGRFYGFLYEDNVDHLSTLAVVDMARAAPPISDTDQVLALGDGATYVFQLIKTYAAANGTNQVRTIQKPMPGTTLISVNGVSRSNWSVDPNSGLVTFGTDLIKFPLNGVTLSALGSGFTITGTAGMFAGFADGDHVTTDGWANPNNNFDLTTQAYIGSIATDTSWIAVDTPSVRAVNAGSTNGVNVSRHPAPNSGLSIKAGYAFYVPVRFDTDRLPVSIDEYGIGGANDVKLIELRPGEALS
jgi:uncharacterized protein (TIGR02217 family)